MNLMVLKSHSPQASTNLRSAHREGKDPFTQLPPCGSVYLLWLTTVNSFHVDPPDPSLLIYVCICS